MAAMPSAKSVLRLASHQEGLTFDEYIAVVCAHPKWKLLGERMIYRSQICGVPTWRVAPVTGRMPVFCVEFDRPARLISEALDELAACGDDFESTAAQEARRPRWSTRGRWSRFTEHFTLRPPRRPLLRADRDESPALSLDDFKDLLQRPEYRAEALRSLADEDVKSTATSERPQSKEPIEISLEEFAKLVRSRPDLPPPVPAPGLWYRGKQIWQPGEPELNAEEKRRRRSQVDAKLDKQELKMPTAAELDAAGKRRPSTMSPQPEERAALEQQPRYRTPAQRALVKAFNRRAAAARAADKRRHD